jgi:hypothetical protein
MGSETILRKMVQVEELTKVMGECFLVSNNPGPGSLWRVREANQMCSSAQSQRMLAIALARRQPCALIDVDTRPRSSDERGHFFERFLRNIRDTRVLRRVSNNEHQEGPFMSRPTQYDVKESHWAGRVRQRDKPCHMNG